MGGVKLSFPQTYYNSIGVHYGEDNRWFTWNRNDASSRPGQDAVIRDFMLILNRDTFEPICSMKDLLSYAGNYRAFNDQALPPRITRWLQFNFEQSLYSERQGSLKYLFDAQMAVADVKAGPLLAQGLEFGL